MDRKLREKKKVRKGDTEVLLVQKRRGVGSKSMTERGEKGPKARGHVLSKLQEEISEGGRQSGLGGKRKT